MSRQSISPHRDAFGRPPFVFFALAATLVLSACDGEGPALQSQGRLVVSSTTESEVYVADLDSSEVYTFPVAASAAFIWGWDESPVAFLVHYPHGVVELLDSGSRFMGGAGRVVKTPPVLSDESLLGDAPTHVTRHDGWFAVYFDGLGEARLLSENQVEQDVSAEVEGLVNTNIPHHGVAVVSNDHVLITEGREAEPEDNADGWGPTIPVAISVRRVSDPDVVVHTTDACTKLHGEVVVGSAVAYACDEGILLVELGGSAVQSRHLAYPAGAPGRAFTLTAAGSRIVGDYFGALVHFAVGDDAVQLWSLPNEVLTSAFAVDARRGDLLALGLDGQLYRASLDGMAVTDPAVSIRAPLDDPQLRMSVVVARDYAFVLDASSSTVVAVDLESWTRADELTLELPTAVASGAVVAASP